MPEPSAKRKISWFDVGAGLLFVAIGLLLLGRGLWHVVLHHELLPKTFMSSALFFAVGVMFARQAMKSKRPPRQKLRGKISKRHRRIPFFVLLLVLSSPSSQAQAGSLDGARSPSVQVPSSSPCAVVPVNTEKLAERQAKMRRLSERARPPNLEAIERDRRLGLRLAAEIDGSARLYRNSATQAYVERVVRDLARNADAAIPFTVKIIESDGINAFSLPGGFLYLTTGLLKSTETEAQLAGLLSHEIAHVVARHGARQRKKRTILTWVSVPLMFAGPAGFLIRQVAGIAMPLKFSRDAETEADLVGIDLLDAAGYDPSEYLRWMETAVPCASKPSRIARMFDSYPVFQERLALMQFRAADLPSRPEYVVSTSEFDDTRQALLAGDASQSRAGLRPTLNRRGAERNNEARN